MLAGVCDKLTGHFTIQLDQAAAVIQTCDASCVGHFHLHCDQAEEALAKRYAKVENWLVAKLSQAYGLLSSFGVTLPTPEQLEAHAAGSPRAWPSEQPTTGDVGGNPAGDFSILPPGYSVPASITPYDPALPLTGLPMGLPAGLPAGPVSVDLGAFLALLGRIADCLCRSFSPDESAGWPEIPSGPPEYASFPAQEESP